jgi:hypothetical protein
MSQNSTILAYLKLHPITQRQAANLYDIYRLAPRIHELRAKGHDIRTDWAGTGQTRYARYRLVQDDTER